MGCSLGKQAKKEAEEENLVDKPAEKNEENVLFERPAASGENAQEPLLPEGAAEVAKEATPDAKIDNTELDILKDVAKVDESLTAEVAKAIEAVTEKKDDVQSPIAEAEVTTEAQTTLEKIEKKDDEDFVMVDKKDVSDDIKATAMEVASEVVKSVTEECKTLITKEVSTVSSSTSEKVSKLSSGASETISKTSGDVSETITKYTSSASESVSKLSCSSTQEYKSVVTSSKSKFTDSLGNEIESTPVVEVKEDVVTEMKEKSEQSSKTVEEIVNDVMPTPETEKEEEKEVPIVQAVSQTVSEATVDLAGKVEDIVVPAVEDNISKVVTTVKESVPFTMSDEIIPPTADKDETTLPQESDVSTAISSDVDTNEAKEIVQESSTDVPAVVEEAVAAPIEADLTETSVDSGKIAETDITETSVDAIAVSSSELQETSVDSGAVQEAITETSVDSILESSQDNFPPPPALEAEENVAEVVEKAEDIFKSEHEKQVEANQILAADLMTAEVPSALPSPKGAYEEDLLLPCEEPVDFFSKENAEFVQEPIVEEEKQEIPLPVAPISDSVLEFENIIESIQEYPKEETEPEVVQEIEQEETKPEVVQEIEQEETKPEVVQEIEQAETEPEVVQEIEQAETEPEVVKEIERAETEPEVVQKIEQAETEPEVVQEIEQAETEPEVVQEIEQAETEPEVVQEIEQAETEPEVVQEIEQAETEPEVVQEIEQAETEPEVVQEIEQAETEPEVVQEIEQVETEPEVVKEIEQIETEPEVVQEIEQEETKPEVVQEIEQVETEPEMVQEIQQVETEPEMVQEIEPKETEQELLKELLEDIEEKLEQQVEELVEQEFSEEKELCDVPIEENIAVESEEVMDSKVENDMLAEASTLSTFTSEGSEQTESAAAEAVTLPLEDTWEETETQELINNSQEEKVEIADVNVPVIENNEPTEKSEIVSNGSEQIDFTGSIEQVPTTAANIVESVLDSVKSEFAAVMEELPVQKSAALSENDLDNKSDMLSFSQDIQSLPNGENQVQTLEETGQDPVEGCADLEDRFYNNDSFKRGAEADVSASATERQMEAHSTKDEKTPDDVNDEAKKISATENGDDEIVAATRIQAGYKGYKVRKNMKEQKMKTNAATKIQAGFRGHLTRKNLKTMKEGHDQASHPQLLHHQHEQMHRNQQHIHHIHNMPNVSIDRLPNPDENNKTSHGSDIHRAATKIQAQFRGFRARQEMKVMKVKAKAEQALPTVDAEDPRAHEAATKIQAMIRGRKARKEIKVLRLQNKHSHGRHHGHGHGHGHGHVHHTKSSKSHKDINRDDETENTNNTEGTTHAEVVKAAEPAEVVKEAKTAEDTGNTTVITDDTPKDDTKEQAATNEAEGVIDIDLNDPEVADAASKIQASFRSHKSRRESKKQIEPPELPEGDKDDNNSAIKEDNDIDIDLTDPEVSAAATKIQANFRGHQLRQKLKDTPKVTPSAADVHSEPTQKEEAETKEEEIDIDLTDPEVEAAAQKIQASFRGHMKLKRKQTISKEESPEKEAITSEKDNIEKISSAISSSPITREGSVVEKEDKDVTEKKEEEVTNMKPTEPTVEKVKESESAEGGKNEGTTVVESAEVKKQEVPAEMVATATPQATEAEEIDIDLTDPDVAAATKKLQAGFRGRLNRRKKAKEDAIAASTEKCSSNPTPTPTSQTPTPVEVDSTAAKSSEIDDIDLNDPELAAAAVKIQASFRGHFTRKAVKKNEDVEPASEEAMSQKSESATPVQDVTGDQGQKDEKSINYEDPQVQLAATKIQAGFKGYQTRKSLKKQAGNSGDLEKDSGS